MYWLATVAGVIGLIAAGAFAVRFGDRLWGKVGAGLIVLLSLGGIVFGVTAYRQTDGEASVIVSQSGVISRADDTPGLGFKAPWDNRIPFDLFNQQVQFAGTGDKAPDYSGGAVNGQEITASVLGGAQANVDIQVSYKLTGANVADLYKQYRSQERFTSQIIVPQILSAVREAPSGATPVEFRGAKRGEIQDAIFERLNTDLAPYGVEIVTVTIQDIRFTEDVENSIKAVEVAQQKEAEAQANLAATEVSAQAQVIEAQAEADANALRAGSLTPELIEANRVEALRVAAEKGSLIIVPDGSSPLIQTPAPAAGQ